MILQIRLTPRAGGDAITRYEGGVLHARVAAPPADGAANRALLELLAKALRCPRTSLSIDGGATSRVKRVRVDGMDAADLEARLDSFR